MSGLAVVLVALLLLVLLSVLVSTLITGIPPMPSNAKAKAELLHQVQQLAEEREGLTLVDLGSGWGHLVLSLARRFPQHRVVGYELSFFPWLVNWLLKMLLRLENLNVYHKDFLKADWSGSDVLVCYLMPPTMQKLAREFQQRQQSPTWLISHYFGLPGYHPVDRVELKDLYQSPIYVYCLDKPSTESLTHV